MNTRGGQGFYVDYHTGPTGAVTWDSCPSGLPELLAVAQMAVSVT